MARGVTAGILFQTETLPKIRRLKVGDTISIKATVTRVDDGSDRITIRVPGALAPITAPASYLLDEPEPD
jgi:VCBS repeat-containing protein